MDNNDVIKLFDQSIQVINETKKTIKHIQKAVTVITSSLRNGNKIIIFGNGGSAADAQHMAAELVGRYKLERKSLPAIALSADTAVITAISNDYGFDEVFGRQCESLVKKGDIVIAISTSGMSQNVIRGVQIAKKKGAKIISLTGKTNGKLKNISDIVLEVPSKNTPRIQEGHRTIIHIICELVEKKFKK